jgi:hypothetical protein
MRVSTNGKARRSPEEWRSVINRFETSGLSTRAFCRQEEVTLSSLMRWRRKLVSADAESRFVDVTPPVARTTPGWAIEVELPNGCVVRIRG